MEFNADKYRSNLSYINKDFPSLWNEILETVPKMTNKWIPSESNESDPLVVLLKELAIFADKINYNVDKNVLEMFPATLTQLRSAYNVYESLGYTPDYYISATTSISISYNGSVTDITSNDEKAGKITDGFIIIPKFTQVSDTDSEVIYTLLQDVVSDESPYGFTVKVPSRLTVWAIEGTLNDFEINGSTRITSANLDSQNRLYFTQSNIAQNGIIISNYQNFNDYIYSQLNDPEYDPDTYNRWRMVDNLNQYTSGNRVYKMGLDVATNSVYLQFPEDIGNLIGDGIYIKYILSSGEEGNIGRGDISQFSNVSNFAVYTNTEYDYSIPTSNFAVTNTQSSQNGRNPLDIEEMRQQFNRVVGVFDTLVTLRDYENYIYNYTYANGDYVVSNIRVSDRNNDLNDSVTFKQLNTSTGQVEDSIDTLTSSNNTPLMTAYDLRLYPLQYVTPIETKGDLDLTFNLLTDGTSVGAQTLDNLNIEVQNCIEDAKCISHDFVSVGNAILVPYTLNGQIYLQSAVSKVEASEIMGRVEEALSRQLNSRELNWGEAVDYGTVSDCIKNADERIQYVALEPINYVSNYTDVKNLPTSSDSSLDVNERNILKGNKSWTTFKPFVFDYNQSDATTYSGEINSISTTVAMTNYTSANSYVVNPNETLTILAPQYTTVEQYTNYLYYVYNISNDISANTPVMLKDAENIWIFTTRENAESYANNHSSVTPDYTIGKDTIISSSIALATNNSGKSLNMGSSVSINVLRPSEQNIASSVAIATGNSENQFVYMATNVEGLNINSSGYTLLNGQYVFYTDELLAELVVVGEGTTLSSASQIDGIEVLNDDDLEELLSNNRVASSVTTSWTRVSSNAINCKFNELYTFGENYVVNFVGPTGSNIGDVIAKSVNNFATFPTGTSISYALANVTKSESNGTVEYSIEKDNVYSIPKILENDSYQILTRLSLQVGPGISQNIISRNAVSISGPTGAWSVPSIAQQITIGGNITKQYFTIPTGTTGSTVPTIKEESDSSYTISPNAPLQNLNISELSVQSSRLLSYQGGPTLSLSDSESNVSFYTSVGPTGGGYSYIRNGTFLNVGLLSTDSTVPTGIKGPTGATYVTTLQVPYISVIGYVSSSSSNTVNYVVANGGSNITVWKLSTPSSDGTTSISQTAIISNTEENKYTEKIIADDIIYLTRPYAVESDATYYSYGSDNNTMDVSSLVADANFSLLGENEIYHTGYCPLYVPTEEELISDPQEPQSFFLSQHPYNNFTLPYLSSINVTISPLSIVR